MRVVGVDGCRGGWVVATVEDGAVTWTWTDEIELVLYSGADAVGIDVPIGLPDIGPRACDIEARNRLGARRSSVFPAPTRGVLAYTSYADARGFLADRGGPSMSAQAFGIVRAVRQVDAVMTPELEMHVIEIHPEVSFATMTGPSLPPKKSAAGVGRRLAALTRWIDVAPVLSDVPPTVPVDDALDALACAWSAERWARGDRQILGDGARDARGLVMRIVI